jgi:hypothetical protein
VHNTMVYATGDVPVGAYDSTRLSNLGIGHGVVDFGVGYTYLNPQTGNEFSAVLGVTYNHLNNSTQYQNGVDLHLDWGTSHFFTKQVMAGLVGYVYKEVGCDSGIRTASAASSRRWSASARRSDSSSRSAICRATSISRATRNSPRRTAPMAGTPG